MDKEPATSDAQVGEFDGYIYLAQVPLDTWWQIPNTSVEIYKQSTDVVGALRYRFRRIPDSWLEKVVH